MSEPPPPYDPTWDPNYVAPPRDGATAATDVIINAPQGGASWTKEQVALGTQPSAPPGGAEDARAPPAQGIYAPPPGVEYYPPPGGQYPPPGGQYPSPGGGGQYPSPGGHYPPTGGQYLPTGGQYPPPGGQYPPAGAPFPTSPGEHYPDAGPYPPPGPGPYPPPGGYVAPYPPSGAAYPPAGALTTQPQTIHTAPIIELKNLEDVPEITLIEGQILIDEQVKYLFIPRR